MPKGEKGMDFDISYYKFHGVVRADLLADLGLRDTGVADPTGAAPYAIADLPNGWFVIRTQNDTGLVKRYDRRSLSRQGRLVTCDVAAVDPVNRVGSYEQGEERWVVTHDGRNNDRLDLNVCGDVPDELLPLRRKAFDAAIHELKDPRSPDSMFDVPLELIKAVTGFRHDRPQDIQPVPVFTWLEPVETA